MRHLANMRSCAREATMVINVNIPDGTDQKLAERAALRGQSVESYAADLIRKGVVGNRTFAEILAPFREEVAKSELPDSDLDSLFEEALNDVRAAKEGQE
jgi:plasmid stability protein